MAGNWTGGLPGVGDTALFNSSVTVVVDINPSIAALNIINNAAVILSAGGARTITAGGGTPARVFYIETGSSLTLGSGFGVSINTYGIASTNTAAVDGTLILGQGNSTWTINSLPFSLTNVDISGTVRVLSTNTGSGLLSGTVATLRFLSGSLLDWQRSGGAAPNANFQNGSTFNITGIVAGMIILNSTATYNGLLIWNCPSQTISGSSALLLPSTSATMDSIRVVSTGTGTVRLATNPNGYTIGHLEVQGGALELGAPGAAAGTANITTDIKISGGTLKCNSTYGGDILTAYPLTVTVNGSLLMTGGIVDLTDRPGPLNGPCQLVVKSHIQQSAGTIQATTSYGSQNQLSCSGISPQNLQLAGVFTGSVNLVINNTTGVSLQNTIVLPLGLVLQSGYLSIGNNTLTVGAAYISQLTAGAKVVTDGNGFLVYTSITAGRVFYVGPDPASYNPVTISNTEGLSFSVRVENGINPAIANPLAKVVTKTWNINASVTPSLPVSTTFEFVTGEWNPGFSVSSPAEIGRFVTSAWNLVVNNQFITWAGPYSVNTSAITSFNSPFIIGNNGAILAIESRVNCNAEKVNHAARISWDISDCTDAVKFDIQRADAGNPFHTIAVIDTLNSTCQFDFTDTDPGAGQKTYRICMRRRSGEVVYSNTASVNFAGTMPALLDVWPNPSSDYTRIRLFNENNSSLKLVLSDLSGRVIRNFITTGLPGIRNIVLDLSNLPAGQYYLQVQSASGVYFAPAKLIKL